MCNRDGIKSAKAWKWPVSSTPPSTAPFLKDANSPAIAFHNALTVESCPYPMPCSKEGEAVLDADGQRFDWNSNEKCPATKSVAQCRNLPTSTLKVAVQSRDPFKSGVCALPLAPSCQKSDVLHAWYRLIWRLHNVCVKLAANGLHAIAWMICKTMGYAQTALEARWSALHRGGFSSPGFAQILACRRFYRCSSPSSVKATTLDIILSTCMF